MRTIVLIILTLFTLFSKSVVLAQTQTANQVFHVKLDSPSQSGTLVLKQVKGGINVMGYNGKDVIIAVSYNNKDILSSSDTPDSVVYNYYSSRLSIQNLNNTITVKNRIPKNAVNFKIKVPYKFNLILKTTGNGDIIVNGIEGELELKNVGDNIIGSNIRGIASADTTSGNIIFDFNSINQNSYMAFSSYSGRIDITLPSNVKANLNARSKKGNIISNFKLKTENEIRVSDFSNQLIGKINGGGTEIYMFTHFKDIKIHNN